MMLNEQAIKTVMISIVAGCAEYKPGTKEILCEDEFGADITIEFLSDDYMYLIERRCGADGKVLYDRNYKNYKPRGLSRYWMGDVHVTEYKDGEIIRRYDE
jgi:hypothetical protein